MAMKKDWILLTKETRRTFSKATWVPLRAFCKDESGPLTGVGYICDCFSCGSVAFAPEHRERAEKLNWSDIGIGHSAIPYAYEDGYYASIDQYQYNDREPIGVELVFEHPQPVVGGNKWILNPDLVVALRLIKEGANWVRPEENFVVAAREVLEEDGSYRLIEIKREFLMDYLAARGLSLRISAYRQRVEHLTSIEGTDYSSLETHHEQRNDGRFELRINSLNDIFGGSWAAFRAWRTDVDEEEDAPVMGPESDENTDFESSQGNRSGYEGIRIEGEFWRDEWIDHQNRSVRVRGDADDALPQFIVDTDGSRLASMDLNDENVGRWLWFHASVIGGLIRHRGFSLKWYTSETGAIVSTSGYSTHFGINDSDLITVYAYDIARLPAWEQHVWSAHNVVPEGKVSRELLASQVEVQPASTHAAEEKLFGVMRMLEVGFQQEFGIALFNHDIEDHILMQQISRFASTDQASLLRLAKEIVRVFSDRLNVRDLRKISDRTDKDKLGSNKLLQDVLSQKVGLEKAQEVFRPIVGAYDMRVGDAHPTSSKIGEALELAGIDQNMSYLRQGEQLIHNFGRSVWLIGRLMFSAMENAES